MGFKPTQVSKLLGTANDGEQVKRIQLLQQPVAVITLVYDPRTDAIGLGIVGGPITYEALRMVLQRAIEGSFRDETARKLAALPSSTPSSPPPAPTAPPAPAGSHEGG